MKSTRLLILLALLAWVNAGPINLRSGDDSTSCARQCTASNKFKYVPGVTYEHEYHVTTETLMEGANGEKAVIEIRALADIEALSKCDFALRLRDVKLFDSSQRDLTFVDNSGRFRRVLERNPLRFSYQDGVIEDLCPTDDEEPWALNIKKGVLTILQNSMNNLDQDETVQETDVTGNCVTDYKVTERGWYANTVKKTKDLLSCTGRHGYQSAMHAIPYRVPSNIQSMPLMKSTHECEHKLSKDSFMTSAICRESHVFRPFSKENSGAITHVTQRLEFKQRRAEVATDRSFVGNRVNMKFQHVNGIGHGDEERNLESKLNELCVSSEHDIRPEIPRLFSDLVFIVRDVDSAVIRRSLTAIKQQTLCRGNAVRGRKFLLDAIPMAGTSASVQILKELLLSKDVTGVEADMWLTSLAFIQYPTKQMLEEVKPLVESSELKLKAMLPVSSLVNNYCERHDCTDDYAVDNIISSLESNIGYRCQVRDAKLDLVLMTLRSIGNAGHVRRISSIMSKCFTESRNPMEVRIAAVDGFRRVPCDADRSEVLSLYQDVEEDSEMRVGAYLALMECPTDSILNIITQTLEREKTSQVGSFVWSHLTNLMESASPHKQSIRAILEREELKKEFDLNKMKYSRNYEGSLFFERFNTGAMLESNLIFSPKSFIPRSAMLNLTVDLFGNSMNLFELGGRVEGLEYLLETYLGPYGYFGDANAKRTIAQSREKLDQLRGSMYMRMFGNEISYKHFKGIDSFTDGKSFNVLETLIRLSKEHDYAVTQSVMFLDSTMIIPTSSGLPLNLTVNGTATVDIKAVGKIDLRKVHRSPRSLLVDGTIQPSGAIRFAGAMTIDAFATKTGMRIVNTWHSSTSVRGRIELDRGKILVAEIDSPKNKMEILDVQTAFFSIHGDIEREEKLMEDNRKTIKLCSGQRLASVIGLEACAELHYVNASYVENAPYFPLTGPIAFGLTLESRDTHTAYKLIAKRTETKSSSAAQLAFDTPGSRVNRALAFDMSMNYKQKNFDFSLVSPWKEVSLKGSMKNDRDMKKLDGVLVIDKTKEYALSSEIAIQKTKNNYAYTPRIEIRRPGAEPVRMTGQLAIQIMKKVDLELELVGLMRNPLTIKSTILNTEKETGVKLIVGLSDKQKYSMDAGLIHQKGDKSSFKFIPTLIIRTPESTPVSINGELEYKEGKSLKGNALVNIPKLMSKPIALKGVLTSGRRYTGEFTVSSKYLIAKVNGNLYNKKGGAASKLTVDYNLPKHKNIRKNKITLSWKMKNKSTNSLYKYLGNANMVVKKNPELNFQVDLDLSHNQRRHSGINVQVKYGKNVKDVSKVVSASANVNHAIKSNVASIDYKFALKHPAQNTNIILKGKHKHDSKSIDCQHGLTYGNGKKISTTLTLRDNSKILKKMSGDFKLNYPGTAMAVTSYLTQPSSNSYKHTINSKFGRRKASMMTVYTRGKDGTSHTFDSDISLPSFSMTKITGSTNLNPIDFKAAGNIKYGKDGYGLKTSYKYREGTRGLITLDVKSPSRQIEIELVGEKNDSKYSTSADVIWNKGKKVEFSGSIDIPSVDNIDSSVSLKYPSQSLQFNMKHNKRDRECTTHADFSWDKERMVLDTTFRLQGAPGNSEISGTFSLTTPFKPVRDVAADFRIEDRNRKYSAQTNLSWDRKRKEISSSVSIAKPISVRRLDLSVTANTPFEQMRRVKFDINHALSNKLDTEIKASVNNTKIDLIISGENRGDSVKRDIQGQISFKSNIRKFRSLGVQMFHVDDWKKYDTTVAVEINQKHYVYKFDMNHENHGLQIKNNGKFELSSPYFSISNNWQHHNTDRSLKTVINSDWGRGKKIRFDISGSHASSPRTKTIGSLNLETPWDPLRSVNIDLRNEFDRNFVAHQIHYIHDGRNKVSTNMNYVGPADQIDFDFIITTPWTDEMSGKLNTRLRQNPMTGHAEFQLSPYKRFEAEGSLTAISVTNFDGTIRISTPYREFERIIMRASQRKERSELISTGSVDYGVRKPIEFESRIQMENGIKLFGKVETPFTECSEMRAGFQFSGSLHDFSTKAELTVSPIVGTYRGTLNWNFVSDLNGKLRIDTPLERFPYFQLFALSEKRENMRHSRVEVEYSPKQTITIDASFTFQDKIFAEATVITPFTNARHSSASFRHEMGRQRVQTSARAELATYEPVSANLKLKWAAGIDGTLKIKTPLKNFESSKLVLHHHGTKTDFTSSGFLEFNKEKILSIDAEYKNKYATKAAMTISSSRFNDVKMSIMKEGNLENFKTSAHITYGDSQKINAIIQNRMSPRKVRASVTIETPLTDPIKIVLEHNGKWKRFTTILSGSIGREYTFANELAFTFDEPLIEASNRLNYKINDERKEIGLTIHKDGPLENLKAKIDGNIDEKHVTINADFTAYDTIQGNLEVRTPIDNFKNVGLSFNHGGIRNKFKSEGQITYMDGQTVHGKVDFLSSSGDIIGNFKVQTPFNKFRDIGISVTHAGTRNNIKSEGQVTYMDGKTIQAKADVSSSRSGDLNGSLKVKTPFDNFRDVGLSFVHGGTRNKFTSEGSVTYMDGQTIQGKADISSLGLRNFRGKLTAITPFHDYRETSVEHSHRLTDSDIKMKSKIALPNSPVISSDIHVKIMGSKTEITMVANTNINRFRKIALTMKKSGEINNLTGEFSLIVDDQIFKGDVTHRNIGGNIATKIVIVNPFTEKIDIDIQHSRRSTGFSTSAGASLGSDTRVDGRITFNHERDGKLALTSEAEYQFDGIRNNAKFMLEKRGTVADADVDISGSINEKRIDIHASFQNRDRTHGEITVKIPFRYYRDFGLRFDYSGSINDFSFNGELQYTKGKTITVELNHSHHRWNRIDSKAKITTPIRGYEVVNLAYRHTMDSDECNCDLSVEYREGKRVTGMVRTSLIPNPHFEIKLTTPYDGFRTWSAKGQFEAMLRKYEASAQINGGYDKTVAFQSVVDLSGSPYTASVHIQTPFKNFETTELTLSHRGTPTNFRSTAMLKSPYTDAISGIASLNYESPFDLDGEASITSSITRMRNLKLAVKNSNRNDVQRSHTEIVWAPRQEITLDGSYRLHNDWNTKVLTGDIVITTPFEIARRESIRFEQSVGSYSYGQKVEVEHNGETILDMEAECSKSSKYEGSVTVRSPRPMQFAASNLVAGSGFDGNVMLNWNKNEPNSNVRFETTYGNRGQLDKDIKFKMIHPVRTMGVTGSIKATQRHTSSHAELSWDEDAGHKLSYDFDLKDSSRRNRNVYDSTMKLKIPGRSLQMTGSYGDNNKARTVDGAFFWDADEDQNKAVGMRAMFKPSERRAEFALHLPSIGKDIKIGTEMSMNEGRTLFNGKTELSYSHDSRKTLTLLSRLEDISGGYGSNYSLVLGVTHPYTDLDCRLSSNIGQTREKYSAGMDISYRTTRRENKNIALRAAIDRLRNQMNLEIVSPFKRIEVSGEVVTTNPLHLRLRNRYGDDHRINSDLTFDIEGKRFDFSSNYDLEHPDNTIKLYAKYVNSSCFQAELSHRVSHQEHRDALLALRLNTSHLLHTRIHWRPQVIQEVQEYMVRKMESYGKSAERHTRVITSAVGGEIEARYQRTVTHLSKEIEPLREMIDREMVIIGKQMETFSRDLHRMYSRNDFFMRDMGDSAVKAINAYSDLVVRYKQMCEDINTDLTKLVEKIKSFPIRQKYFSAVNELTVEMQEAISSGIEGFSEWISTLDEKLQDMRNSVEHQKNRIQNSVSEYIESIKNHPNVDKVRSAMNSIDYGHYISAVSNKLKEGIRSTNMADKYNSMIYNARELINARLADVVSPEEMNHLHAMANNVYQEGVWAYKYWQVEDNLKKHLIDIMTLIKEMIQEEIERYTPALQIIRKSKVIVFDPEHGEIQLELYLPIPLQSLDTVPNVVPHMKRAYNRYIPSTRTLQKYYDYVPSMFKGRVNNTDENVEFDSQLKQYMELRQPTRPLGRGGYYAIPI